MKLRSNGIVLRPKRTRQQKLNWAETYQQMAQADEDWSGWESLPEGLTAVPGDADNGPFPCRWAKTQVQGVE